MDSGGGGGAPHGGFGVRGGHRGAGDAGVMAWFFSHQVWNSVEINEMIQDPESGFGAKSGFMFHKSGILIFVVIISFV